MQMVGKALNAKSKRTKPLAEVMNVKYSTFSLNLYSSTSTSKQFLNKGLVKFSFLHILKCLVLYLAKCGRTIFPHLFDKNTKHGARY